MKLFATAMMTGLALMMATPVSVDARDNDRRGGIERDKRDQGGREYNKRDRRHERKRHGRKHGRKHHHHKHHDKPTPAPEMAAAPAPAVERRDQSPRIGPGQPTEHLYGVQDGMRYNVYVYEGGVAGLFTPESKRAVSLLSSGAARLDDMDLQPVGQTANGDTIFHLSAPRSDASGLPFMDWLATAW